MQIGVPDGPSSFNNGSNKDVSDFLKKHPLGNSHLSVGYNLGPSKLESHARGRGFIASFGPDHVLYSEREYTYCLLNKLTGQVVAPGLSPDQKTEHTQILRVFVAEQRAMYAPPPEQTPAMSPNDIQRIITQELQKGLAKMEADAQAARDLKAEEARKADEILKAEAARKAHEKLIADERAELAEEQAKFKKLMEDALKGEIDRKAEIDKRIRAAEQQQVAVIPRQQQTPAIDFNVVLVCVVVLFGAVVLMKDPAPPQTIQPPSQPTIIYMKPEEQYRRPDPKPTVVELTSPDNSRSTFEAFCDFIGSVIGYTVVGFLVLMSIASVFQCLSGTKEKINRLVTHRHTQEEDDEE